MAVGAARFPRPIGSVALGTNSPRIGNFWLEACAGSTPYSSHGLPVRVAVGAARFPRPIGSVVTVTNSPRIGNFLVGGLCRVDALFIPRVTCPCGCRVRKVPSAYRIGVLGYSNRLQSRATASETVRHHPTTPLLSINPMQNDTALAALHSTHLLPYCSVADIT